MKNYKEIKEELLENANIYSVNIDSNKGKIFIKPVQNKNFYRIGEPLEEYQEVGDKMTIYNIGDRVFRIHNYESCNTLIYEIVLKEVKQPIEIN
jgi:hypothetical protein